MTNLNYKVGDKVTFSWDKGDEYEIIQTSSHIILKIGSRKLSYGHEHFNSLCDEGTIILSSEKSSVVEPTKKDNLRLFLLGDRIINKYKDDFYGEVYSTSKITKLFTIGSTNYIELQGITDKDFLGVIPETELWNDGLNEYLIMDRSQVSPSNSIIMNTADSSGTRPLTQKDIDELLADLENSGTTEWISQQIKCECGAEVTGNPGHSTWCPKHD